MVSLLAGRVRVLAERTQTYRLPPSEGRRRPLEGHTNTLFQWGQAIGRLPSDHGDGNDREAPQPVFTANAQATTLHGRACAGASATTWMTRRPNFRSARCTRSNFSQRETPGGSVQMTRVS